MIFSLLRFFRDRRRGGRSSGITPASPRAGDSRPIGVTSPDYATAFPARWRPTHPATTIDWPIPRTLSGGSGTPEKISFGTMLRPRIPELGLLEIDDARIVLPAGWILGVGDQLLADHTWYGQGRDGKLPDDACFLGKIEEALRTTETTPLPGTTLTLLTDFGENYYHFLLDALGRLAIVTAAGIDPRAVDRILVPQPGSENARRILAAMGLPADKIVPVGPRAGGAFLAERLLAPTFPGVPRCCGAFVCGFLRDRLPGHALTGRPKTRLYVDRSRGGRPMENRAEVVAVMEHHGFLIYDPSEHDDQPADFAAAEFVVGAHGAGLANLAFASPGTKVLELLPTDHVYPYYFALSLAAGLDHSVLPCRSSDHRPPGAFGPSTLPYHVDIDSLRSALRILDEEGVAGSAANAAGAGFTSLDPTRGLRDAYLRSASGWTPAQKLASLDGIAAHAPNDPWCLLHRATVEVRSGRPSDCDRLFDRLLADDVGPEALPCSLLEELLRAIQAYASTEHRTPLLERLADRAERAIDGGKTDDVEILHARVRLALGDHDRARQVLGGLRSRGVHNEPVPGMWDVCERRASPSFPDHGDAKVFCIGLSKTGTTSLARALSLLGLRVVHWTNPFTGALVSDDDLFLFDAFADVVISWQFERLHALFPAARFVYTTRDVEPWERSIAAHYARGRGITAPHDLLRPEFRRGYGGLAHLAERNLYAPHATWRSAYETFDARVRTFFSDQPTGRFLELAVCDGEGWEKLCGFLGLSVPAAPFPFRNAAPRSP